MLAHGTIANDPDMEMQCMLPVALLLLYCSQEHVRMSLYSHTCSANRFEVPGHVACRGAAAALQLSSSRFVHVSTPVAKTQSIQVRDAEHAACSIAAIVLCSNACALVA